MSLFVKPVCAFFCAAMMCVAQSSSATDVAPPSPAAENTEATAPPPQRKSSADVVPREAASEKADSTKRYVIGSLDVLYIKVWNSANLTGPVDVGPDGILSMPLIGDVKADGLTREQLKEVLTTKLSEFLNNPEVDVTVTKINSKRYFVVGGVLRGGEFPLVKQMTVFDALALSGGFKDFANVKKIYVLRNGKRYFFNYKDVSKGKNMEQNIVLENGDRIIVPE